VSEKLQLTVIYPANTEYCSNIAAILRQYYNIAPMLLQYFVFGGINVTWCLLGIFVKSSRLNISRFIDIKISQT